MVYEGVIGFVCVSELFDFLKGFRFMMYVYVWVC